MQEWVERTLDILPDVFVHHANTGNMMDVYWRCYVVLDHLGEEQAEGVLETAVCQSFLQNIRMGA